MEGFKILIHFGFCVTLSERCNLRRCALLRPPFVHGSPVVFYADCCINQG